MKNTNKLYWVGTDLCDLKPGDVFRFPDSTRFYTVYGVNPDYVVYQPTYGKYSAGITRPIKSYYQEVYLFPYRKREVLAKEPQVL